MIEPIISAEPCTYVYGFFKAAAVVQAPLLQLRRGIDEAPLHIVQRAAIAALVSRHPRARLEALLGDGNDADVKAAASAHHDAVNCASQGIDILPARMGTIWASNDSGTLGQGADSASILNQLDRISGCQEWSISIHQNAADMPAHEDTSHGAAGYLRARHARRQSQQLGVTARAQRVDALMHGFTAISRSIVIAPHPQSRSDKALLLRANALVERTKTTAWIDDLEALMAPHEGWTLDLSGPIAAFSFAERDVTQNAA